MDSKTTFDISTLITTIDFAAKKHVKQRRKDSDATREFQWHVWVIDRYLDICS